MHVSHTWFAITAITVLYLPKHNNLLCGLSARISIFWCILKWWVIIIIFYNLVAGLSLLGSQVHVTQVGLIMGNFTCWIVNVDLKGNGHVVASRFIFWNFPLHLSSCKETTRKKSEVKQISSKQWVFVHV